MRRPIQIITMEPMVKAAPPIFDPNKVYEAPWPTDMIEKSGNVEIYYQRAMKNDMTINVCKALSITTELLYQRIAGYMKATNKPKMQLVVSSLSKNHDGTGGGYHLEAMGTTLFADVKIDKVAKRYDPAFSSFIFVAEATQPMAYFNAPSFSDDFDQGEALSRVMAITCMPGNLGPYGVVVKWLNSMSKRPDYTTQRTNLYSGGPIGCHMAALFWMRYKKKLPWETIIAGGKTAGLTMEQIYQKVTGRTGLYKTMMTDINARYPLDVKLVDNEQNEVIFA